MIDSREKFFCDGCYKRKSISLLVWEKGREYCTSCIEDADEPDPIRTARRSKYV